MVRDPGDEVSNRHMIRHEKRYDMTRRVRTALSLAAAVVLACCCMPVCGTAEEIILDEIELDDESGLIGRAEDLVFHSANENSPVKCNHPLCFWNMKMGWMD